MKTALLLLFFFYFVNANSQVISGKIVDIKNKPLSGANIYFDGTTIATTSNEKGNFTIKTNTKLNSVLVISFIGFQTQYISNVSLNNLQIVLKENIDLMKEVVIKKDRFTRKQKLQLFREQFLGQTKAGKKATIQNEDDIYFEYNEKTRTLNAFSDKPLVVNNEVLGYKIVYEIQLFEVSFWKISISSNEVTKSFYAGVSRFEETDSSENTLKQREKSYQGSQLHFFRNLAIEKWGKDDFLLFVGSFQDNPKSWFSVNTNYDFKIVTISKQDKKLSSIKNVVAEFNILFKKKQQSKVIFATPEFQIDAFGNNSNIDSIYFSGYLATLKVGDMLPMDYKM